MIKFDASNKNFNLKFVIMKHLTYSTDFGGNRYGGMDRGMDRGPPQRSRDPPMSRGRDYSPGPRDFSRSSGPERLVLLQDNTIE